MRRCPGDVRNARCRRAAHKITNRFIRARHHQRAATKQGTQQDLQPTIASNIVKGTPHRVAPQSARALHVAGKAREAVQSAEFARDRMKTVLPRLHERFDKVAARERFDAWKPKYQAAKSKRDELAAKLADRYPAVVEDHLRAGQRRGGDLVLGPPDGHPWRAGQGWRSRWSQRLARRQRDR